MASRKSEHLTMAEVIALAKKKGINFTYRKRKDGSYRVMTLEGVKFKSDSSKGNAALRKMVGASLSRRRSRQLKEARPKLPRKVKNALNRARRGKFGKGKPKVGFTEARRSVKEIGEEATIRNIEKTLEDSEELVDPNRLDALLALLEARLEWGTAWGVVSSQTLRECKAVFRDARKRGVRKPARNVDIVDATGYYDLLGAINKYVEMSQRKIGNKFFVHVEEAYNPALASRLYEEIKRFLRELKSYIGHVKTKKK